MALRQRALARHLAYGACGLVASLVSADAHCYRVWHYPTPQHCGIAHRASEQSHDWYVEIVLPEPPLDERAQAVEALKAKMGE